MATVLVLARTADALTHRHSRAVQRALAAGAEAAAIARLGPPPAGAVNRSHSRGLAAVAAQRSPGPLGVDIEYADPSRPWSAILGRFLGREAGPVEPAAGAAVWTFIEAWYKATQDWPPPRLTAMALEAQSRTAVEGLEMAGPAGALWWRTGMAAEGFPWSVVSGASGAVTRIDLPPVTP